MSIMSQKIGSARTKLPVNRGMLVLGLCVCAFGCQQDPKDNPHLQAANKIYQQSLLMQDAFLVGYDSISQVMFVQNPSDSLSVAVHQSFRSLAQRYRLWESSLVDVPGFEATGATRSLLYGIPPPDILTIHQDQYQVMHDLLLDLSHLKAQLASSG